MKFIWLNILLVVMTAGWAQAADFTLSSPQLQEGGTIAAQQVYSGFGCSGGNVSPQLEWSGAPAGTKSFAVTVYDPDAPTGSGWWHWVVFNIPVDLHGLVANAGDPQAGLAPAGSVQSRTDYGTTGYGGPCPPPGPPHHYVFTVYALKTDNIDLKPDVSAAMVGFYLNANKLASASLTTTYGR